LDYIADMHLTRPGRFVAMAAAALAVMALSVAGPIHAREPGPRDVPRSTTPVPPPFKARSLPFVSITRQDGQVKYYETNAVPLLWERACFGWRTFIGGPNRQVEMVEVLTLSAPAKTMIHGPETVVENNQRAVTRTREWVMDGFIQRAWCILEGDPPGTYRYDVTIDGEPRGEFVFCAIEVASQQEDPDPTELNCPNRFNSVERPRPPAGLATRF
jgi:hypothetical protein